MNALGAAYRAAYGNLLLGTARGAGMPASADLGLFYGRPSTGAAEPADANYVRIPIASTDANWGPADAATGRKPNAGTIGFVPAFADYPQAVTWAALMVGGVVFMEAPLTTARWITAGAAIEFAPGDLEMGILGPTYRAAAANLLLGSARGAGMPATADLAAFYGQPSAGGVQPVGGGYAAIPIASTDANWGAASAAGRKATVGTKTFPTPTVDYTADITWVALLVAGVVFMERPLDNPRRPTVAEGPLEFAAGALEFGAD